jgi:hypothetical protein
MHSVAIGERGASVETEDDEVADADDDGAGRDAALYSSASRWANDENAVRASEARRRALSGSPQSGVVASADRRARDEDMNENEAEMKRDA